jgi:hypothetical protein
MEEKETLRNDTIVTYLSTLKYSFDFSDESKQIVMNLCPSINQINDHEKINNVWLDIFMERIRLLLGKTESNTLDNILLHEKVKFCNNKSDIIQILKRVEHIPDAAFLLGLLYCNSFNEYAYDYNLIAQMIMDKISYRRSFCRSKMYLDIFSDVCLLYLSKLRLNNMIDVITDNKLYDLIKDKKSEQFIQIIESLYKSNRIPAYQTLIIANNTKIILKYVVRISENKTDTFSLKPTNQKVYNKLRDASINFVNIKIYHNQTKKLLFENPYVDIHSYVAAYGSDSIKFAVYYEPDALLDSESMQPNDCMILNIGNLLKKEYEVQKKSYPGMKFDFFIGSMAAKSGDAWNEFTTNLTNAMRPSLLKKAIDIIIGN